MVVIGNYSICLVDAETKTPFKEHKHPGGRAYTEVEPDMDYLIEVDVVGGDYYKVHYFQFIVDGTNLGYSVCCERRNTKSHQGIWSYHNGTEKLRALSFQRPKFNSGGSTISGGDLMGKVEVQVFEAVYLGTLARTNFLGNSVSPTSIASDLTHAQTKKVLRSGEGFYCKSQECSTVSESYSKGEFLASITINYCTALGLIKAGVLSKPPLWVEHRMANPAKRGYSNAHAVDVKPKKVKYGAVFADGETLQTSKESELFDLSGVASDDES